MFISPAYAQDAAAAGAGGGLGMLMPMILIFVVFYFLLIRPQQKRMKEHKAMLSSIQRGDRVVTNGGLIGKVSKVVNDEELEVEIADGIKVRVRRALIAEGIAKTQPAAANSDKKDGGEKESGGAASTLKNLLGKK
ncbi:MAG: preprotein translocase subunit YajC [Magnetospiraceae bacterium]